MNGSQTSFTRLDVFQDDCSSLVTTSYPNCQFRDFDDEHVGIGHLILISPLTYHLAHRNNEIAALTQPIRAIKADLALSPKFRPSKQPAAMAKTFLKYLHTQHHEHLLMYKHESIIT